MHESLCYSILINQPWIKRDSETSDVTMEAYDGAEICELVGISIL